MVRRLLDLYKTNYEKLARARSNRDKAKWWEKLALDFNNEFNCDFSKERLRNKIHNLKSKFKKVETPTMYLGQEGPTLKCMKTC